MELHLLLQAVLTALSALAVIAIFVTRRRIPSKERPPGPRKLPVVGNLHQIAAAGKTLHQSLSALAAVHGPVMTVWLGSGAPVIVVSGAELVWEVLVSKSADFAARWFSPTVKPIVAAFRTVSSSDAGPEWHSLKRGLQGAPLGPSNVASQFELQQKDLAAMIEMMKAEGEKQGHVIQPLGGIRWVNIRLLSQICFGTRDVDKEFVESMDTLLEDTLKVAGYATVAEAFPFASFLPTTARLHRSLDDLRRRMEALIRPLFRLSPAPASFLHVLRSQNLPENVIIANLFEVFVLGVDSTSSTILWALALLIHHPDVQEKLYTEISDHFSETQKMKLEDVGKLEYLQAVVKETMRMKPIAPLAVPHRAAKDTLLKGWKVSKGTNVMVNLHSVLMDPGVWGDPECFWPERFLPRNGGEKLQRMEQSFIPFGAGMRMCGGWELGKLQVSLALVYFVRAFRWLPETQGRLPDLTEAMEVILAMKTPLRARIECR